MNDVATGYQILSLCFRDPQGPVFSALQEAEPFRETLRSTTEEALRSEYTRLLSLTVAGGIPPYETEYGHKDIFLKTQSLADIAGFYRAFGLEIADQNQPRRGVEGEAPSGLAGGGGDASPCNERVDFIGAELEFMHTLVTRGERARERGNAVGQSICRDAEQKFFRDHLGRWASYFGGQIANSARLPFYQQVGQWLFELIESECGRLAVQPERVSGWNPDPVPASGFECGMEGQCPG